MSKILIVDDEVQIRTLLARMMELEGYEVCQAGDCRAALKQLELQSPDVALCDVFLPDGNGVDLVLAIKKAAPNVEVILLTAHGNIPDGVQAIKNGAFDYITKGDDNNKIIPLISRAVEKAAMNARLEKLEKKVGQAYSFDSILGESKSLKDAVLLAQKVSVTDVPVLLTGETGTGKEVFAQAIHYSSKRARQNFVAVNCSSFSKELLESEMFGHKAGSFTGALKDKKGLFEEANNGTIFLDEIGNLSYEVQIQLLRALQERKIRPVGSTQEVSVDIRLVSATNENLEQAIEKGTFREDLFHRINEFTLRMPDLKERKEDILLFANFFLDQANKELDKHLIGFDAKASQALMNYHWPGNLRQMKNIVKRATLLAQSSFITLLELGTELLETPASSNTSIALRNEETEKEHILEALRQTGNNKSKAAQLLNIDRKTLYNKLKLYNCLLYTSPSPRDA